MRKYGQGWFLESKRHSLARQGIKTGRKQTNYSLGINYAKKQKGINIKDLPKTVYIKDEGPFFSIWLKDGKRKDIDMKKYRSFIKWLKSHKIKIDSEIPDYAKDDVKKVTTYVHKEGFELSFMPVEDTLKIKKTKDGYTAKYLVQDDNPESPDEWKDDSLFLVHYHRDFSVERDNIITEDDTRKLYQAEDIPQLKKYWIFPVDAYIHGGVSLSMAGGFRGRLPQGHEQFDVSSVGLILVSKKEFKSREKAQKAAKDLLGNWNTYLTGDVYGIVKDTYDKNKKLINNDSVWGNYGFDNAKKELIDYVKKSKIKIRGFFKFDVKTDKGIIKQKQPFDVKELYEVQQRKTLLESASNIKNVKVIFKGSELKQ